MAYLSIDRYSALMVYEMLLYREQFPRVSLAIFFDELSRTPPKDIYYRIKREYYRQTVIKNKSVTVLT